MKLALNSAALNLFFQVSRCLDLSLFSILRENQIEFHELLGKGGKSTFLNATTTADG